MNLIEYIFNQDKHGYYTFQTSSLENSIFFILTIFTYANLNLNNWYINLTI